MLRHLFQLMWNRKRANALLLTEIVCSFVVLFGIGTVLGQLGGNYLAPRGFDYAPVWHLAVSAPGGTMPRAQLDEVLRQVRTLPGVQALTLTSANTPFAFQTRTGSISYRGRTVTSSVDRYDADDAYAQTLGLRVREGRWFESADDGIQGQPVVISQTLRQQLFGPAETAVGKIVRDGSATNPTKFFVVGVVEDVRMGSDFTATRNSIWMRLVPHDTTRWETAAVLLRTAPAATAALEQQIFKTIARVSGGWVTQVRTLEEDRHAKGRITTPPVVALALVGLFLILNVALGLFGVLWYNIQQRRSEIGLRRALGSTGGGISRQFLIETLILTLFGIGLGGALAVQFPLLGAFGVPASTYGRAIALAAALIFGLAAVCALYPSRLAAGVRPAVALREE